MVGPILTSFRRSCSMSLKLCEPKNIWEKKSVLMLRHICYDINGSALKVSGTLMIP